MCGIAGIYAYHYAANAVDRDELLRIRDHMTARGPDGAGIWSSTDGRVGLAHRRLAIIDLSDGGAQPKLSADGKIAVTFNGEIYNYRHLRAALESDGFRFTSESDTEVLLHLYRARGPEMVHELRGMFSFGLWDGDKRSLLLARDPYGIKPLYYANDGWALRFASQVKALLAGGKTSREPDPAGWAGYYLWGSVPEPYTTYRDVRSVEAGTFINVTSLGPLERRRYFSLGNVYLDAESKHVHADPRESQERLRASMLDTVRHHLVADVPVGAFLSAGIDSGSLLGLMRDAGQSHIKTLTLEFSEFSGIDDEGPLAAQVAQLYGAEHVRRSVRETEFQADLPGIVEAMDQPTIDGVNAWFVSKAAHECGLKVAISGLGGDELLGGYGTFRDVPRLARWLWLPSQIPGLGRLARSALSLAGAKLGWHPKSAGVLELGGDYAGAYFLRRGLFMPWELASLIGEEFAREGLRRLGASWGLAENHEDLPRSQFARVAVLESNNYMRNQLLRDTDWASMAHSLEIRVPLVDSQLIKDVAPLTVRGLVDGKRGLANSPTTPLPRAVTSRNKTGFTTPVATWQRHQDVLRPTKVSKQILEHSRYPWARRWALNVASHRCPEELA